MLNTKLLMTLVAFVLLVTSGVSASTIRPALSAKQHSRQKIFFPHRGTDLLYDQSDNDNGQGIIAQNFEPQFDAYDSEAADDVKVPKGKTWKITEIYVDGTYFDGTGSANSFNVTFYSSNKGEIGRLVQSCPNAKYYYDTQVDLGSEYIKCKVKLRTGSYFVAVQANMDFSKGGQWGWLTNNTVRHNPSLWRNPQDGFGTGCTDFDITTTCIVNGEGGDYAFALYGKAKDSGASHLN